MGEVNNAIFRSVCCLEACKHGFPFFYTIAFCLLSCETPRDYDNILYSMEYYSTNEEGESCYEDNI
jgi:hypothetical protein